MAIQQQSMPSFPDDVLAAAQSLGQLIQEAVSDRIEADRRIPPDLARAMMEAGIFRMAAPRVYGGGELDPMTQVRVVEELARMEGSVENGSR